MDRTSEPWPRAGTTVATISPIQMCEIYIGIECKYVCECYARKYHNLLKIICQYSMYVRGIYV